MFSILFRILVKRLGHLGMAIVVMVAALLAGGAAGATYGTAHGIAVDAYLKRHRAWATYHGPSLAMIGAMLGVGCAVLTGTLYCWLVIASSRRIRGWALIGRGAWLGVAAGIVSAFIVHAGLIAAVRTDPLVPDLGIFNRVLFIGASTGALVGIMIGALGGRLADVPPTEPSERAAASSIPPVVAPPRIGAQG